MKNNKLFKKFISTFLVSTIAFTATQITTFAGKIKQQETQDCPNSIEYDANDSLINILKSSNKQNNIFTDQEGKSYEDIEITEIAPHATESHFKKSEDFENFKGIDSFNCNLNDFLNSEFKLEKIFSCYANKGTYSLAEKEGDTIFYKGLECYLSYKIPKSDQSFMCKIIISLQENFINNKTYGRIVTVYPCKSLDEKSLAEKLKFIITEKDKINFEYIKEINSVLTKISDIEKNKENLSDAKKNLNKVISKQKAALKALKNNLENLKKFIFHDSKNQQSIRQTISSKDANNLNKIISQLENLINLKKSANKAISNSNKAIAKYNNAIAEYNKNVKEEEKIPTIDTINILN